MTSARPIVKKYYGTIQDHFRRLTVASIQVAATPGTITG
jgi:hypothetical protein